MNLSEYPITDLPLETVDLETKRAIDQVMERISLKDYLKKIALDIYKYGTYVPDPLEREMV